MSMLATFLLALAVPGVVASTILVVGRAIGRSAVGVTIAVGLAYVSGHLIVAGLAYPPVEVTDRLPWLALAAMVLGLFAVPWPWLNGIRWVARLVVAEAVIAVILGPILSESYETRPNLIWLVTLGNGILIAWAALLALADRSSPAQLWPTLVILAGTSSVVLLGSGSVVLGELGLSLTAALMATALLAWKTPGATLARGGMGVIVTILAALLLEGHVYAGVSPPSLAFLAAIPVAALIGCLGSSRIRKPWQGTLLTLALVVLTAGASVGFALATSSDSGE